MKKGIKTLIIKALILVLPFILCAAPFVYIATATMETADYDLIINKQNRAEHEMVVGMAYQEDTPYYKLTQINEKKPRIASLGTSRVMQFKDFYFTASFYNCGGAVGANYDGYENFIDNMNTDAYPQYLIVGLDQWVFNDAWTGQKRKKYSQIKKKPINLSNTLLSIVKGFIKKDWTFSDIMNGYDNIGFTGIIKGGGYLKDGSYYYNSTYTDSDSSTEDRMKDALERISAGNRRFEYGDHVDSETLTLLDSFLQKCKDKDITVIGILPPFAPSIWEAMKDSKKYGYLDEIYPMAKPIFDKYGYELYDYGDSVKAFSDEEDISISDDFFIDGFHGSDVIYALILKDMAVHDGVLSEYIDIAKIDRICAERVSNLNVIDIYSDQ